MTDIFYVFNSIRLIFKNRHNILFLFIIERISAFYFYYYFCLNGNSATPKQAAANRFGPFNEIGGEEN